jgi:predicted RNase H-like HicB family nuclease
MNLKVKITKDKKTGTYTGQLISLPEVISEGNTIEELKANIIDAFKLVLKIKSGQIN